MTPIVRGRTLASDGSIPGPRDRGELRGRFNCRHQEMVPRAGARHIEQVKLGGVRFLEVGLVADAVDSGQRRQDSLSQAAIAMARYSGRWRGAWSRLRPTLNVTRVTWQIHRRMPGLRGGFGGPLPARPPISPIFRFRGAYTYPVSALSAIPR
jgi:hypothetical protein